ncbi:unnamed protein product [Heligmosomoides polygyrus]|uniref:Uncharacterized protein n=1 Tax=Heligmosomoides polygyrus TaxID=6339 RepID=A0A3P8E1N0_HELPZ|nr:unnamed protein product [Heligmosomoides polygyrus]
MATGHIKGNENPSQLKNSIIVMQKDHMFVTDDQAAKQSLLRHIQRGHFETSEEIYWSKTNGNQDSANSRKLPVGESANNTPETSRLIQRPMEDSIAYNSVVRRGPPSHSAQITVRGNDSPPEGRGQNTFGTLQQQEAYASIHKAKEHALYQRRDSADNQNYGKIENNYGNYGTYARMAPQSRIPIPPGQQVNAMSLNSSGYSQQQIVRNPI